MVPWIRVNSNITTHDKTYKLAETLKIPNYSAVGLMVSLWCWASINAPDGDISKYPPRAITEASGWQKKPDAFYAALLDAGLVEKTGEGRVMIRNWEKYATLLIDLNDAQKKKTAERVRKHRARKSEQKDISAESVTLQATSEPDDMKRYCNVTVTPCNGPTEHNITEHIFLFPSDEENKNNFGGGDEAGAGAEKAVDDFFRESGYDLDSYFGQTEEIKQQVKDITGQIFGKFTTRKPAEDDVARVFHVVKHQEELPDGSWLMSLDSDKIQLLMYAFEQASRAGCSGHWNYIGGCLARLNQRGIKTLAEADDYDVQRNCRC